MPTLRDEPEELTGVPVGWFALIFPDRWQGYFLYSVANGQFALEGLAEANVISDDAAEGALLFGNEDAVDEVVSACVDQLRALFNTDPASRQCAVYGSTIAYLMDHPYFMVHYTTDGAVMIIKMEGTTSVDEARLVATEYPAVKAIEAANPRTMH